MGSNSNDEDSAGKPDASQCESSRIEDIVKIVAEQMHCSLPQARLSIDAVFAAIKASSKPLRIYGFGEFDDSKLRRFKRR